MSFLNRMLDYQILFKAHFFVVSLCIMFNIIHMCSCLVRVRI